MKNKEKLTDEQIKNWKKVLAYTMGVFAFNLSKEEIQRIKDNTQKRFS